ncbi:DUF1449 family protein [Shewanella sp. 4t3-1-2LB]|uniref:OB-fold-containig protein n=1 Tax=Shewanella sp. 4t3-1-2LB TaxID=2817682 RepID=UPI001A98E319|nr:DUF1449 family protein [Shewanella sp. 4t3-1-2LB]
MLDFILANDNLPYVVAATVVVMLAVVEIMARIAGGSLGVLMDEPPALQRPATEFTEAPSLASWLGLNRLPVLLWFIFALVSFAIGGFLINLLLWLSADTLLPQEISVWLAFALTAVVCHLLGRQLNWQAGAEEETDNLCGNIGIMTLGKAIKGNPAEALVHDDQHHIHYVLVEPQEENIAFEAGTRVLLLQREGMIWRAIRFES